ncbi:MAG: hypothetical protein IT428_04355 [Planctomycetaceae bacterium]|nr:hypothetical protein [Planctomycetaceae bacterium]
MAGTGRISSLILDEYFDRGDPRFVETLRETWQPRTVASLADRWKRDPRPWARQAMLEYLGLPWNCPGHQPLLRRLFKQAEAAGDDEIMGAFFVGFDRIVRRIRKTKWRWDAPFQRALDEEVLAVPRNTLPHEIRGRIQSPLTGREISVPPSIRAGRPFTYRTRYYFRRRVWRYFRRLAHQQPERYVPAIARCLVAYREEDFDNGEHILDNRSLMQACFREHPALEFGTAKVWVREGHTLGELTAAPRFPELWKLESAVGPMLDILRNGQSRLVRVWAIGLLRRDHRERMGQLPADLLLRLLDSPDLDVQGFASEFLESREDLATLPLATWMELLRTQNLTALEAICRLMERHVRSDRLSLAECVDVACAEPTPVARLGLRFLQSKPVESFEDREQIARLSHARCGALGASLATWALGHFASAGTYHRDLVQWFFDSPTREVRDGAWAWLSPETAAWTDPVLWSRMLETPWDDLRLKLIDALERRAAAKPAPFPRPAAGDLAIVWCTVLAGVHRGGRQKLKAIRQIAEAIERHPDKFDDLLPVLAVAVRSVRRPEMREALAAVATLAERDAALATRIAAALPELTLG